MSPPKSNVYETPKAELTNTSSVKPILEFERFSAWAVFGLSIITLGIYWIYWLYSRAKLANSLSKVTQVSMVIVTIFMITSIVSTVLSAFVDENSIDLGAIDIANLVVSILYLIFYIMAFFGLRRVLEEIINEGSAKPVHLGGVLTFFFSVIYFQYKINQAIDLQSLLTEEQKFNEIKP